MGTFYRTRHSHRKDTIGLWGHPQCPHNSSNVEAFRKPRFSCSRFFSTCPHNCGNLTFLCVRHKVIHTVFFSRHFELNTFPRRLYTFPRGWYTQSPPFIGGGLLWRSAQWLAASKINLAGSAQWLAAAGNAALDEMTPPTGKDAGVGEVSLNVWSLLTGF